MGPPYSIKISRVSTYSSSPTTTGLRLQGSHLLRLDFPIHSTNLLQFFVTGLFRVRSPLLTESHLISFPTGTKMFQFPAFASLNLCIQFRIPLSRWVSPFRHLRITICLPTPRSFSQATTSFIAFYCQGIHPVRLLSWLYNPQ